MTTRQEVLAYCLTFPDTWQDAPFHDDNWQIVRYKKNKKAFAWTYERNGHMNVNVKVDPEWRDFWRQAYKSVIPGWHQNKEHWNTIILDGTIPEEEIRRMIAESYDLITGKDRAKAENNAAARNSAKTMGSTKVRDKAKDRTKGNEQGLVPDDKGGAYK